MATVLFGVLVCAQETKEKIEKVKSEIDSSTLSDTSKKIIDNLLKTELYRLHKDYDLGNMHDIEIDFKRSGLTVGRGIKLPRKIKKGDFYRVIVNNINPNWYTIKINRKDSVISKELSMPTFSSISLDAIASLTSGFNDSVQIEFAEVIPTTIETPFSIAKSDSINMAIDSVFTKNLFSLDIGLNQLKDQQFFDPEVYVKTLISEHKKITKGISFLLSKDKDQVLQIQNKVTAFRNERLQELPGESVEKFDYSITLLAIQNLRKIFETRKKSFNASNSGLVGNIENNKEVFDFLKKEKFYLKKVEKLKTIYQTALAKMNELNELISGENAEKLLSAVRYLHTGANRFESLPIQFKGEVESLSVSFVPKDSITFRQVVNLSPLIFPVRRPNYWSVGTSFYYSNLSNERFSILSNPKTDSTSVYSLRKEEDIKREAGMAVMLRFGTKIDKNGNFGIHGSFGPGVSIEKNVRPRILFGIGTSYGKKHNIVIDWGGILGYVDRKSSIVEENIEFLEKPETTVTNLIIGNYFSIGYMFKL